MKPHWVVTVAAVTLALLVLPEACGRRTDNSGTPTASAKQAPDWAVHVNAAWGVSDKEGAETSECWNGATKEFYSCGASGPHARHIALSDAARSQLETLLACSFDGFTRKPAHQENVTIRARRPSSGRVELSVSAQTLLDSALLRGCADAPARAFPADERALDGDL